jgi:hypothetical protein
MRPQITYSAIMQLLADREWHPFPELARVCRFPDYWLHELTREGLIEVSNGGSNVMLRLHENGR